jgi:hypothetical protein
VNAEAGETAAAAGCKLFEALRQMPPSPCAVKGAGMNRKRAIPGTRIIFRILSGACQWRMSSFYKGNPVLHEAWNRGYTASYDYFLDVWMWEGSDRSLR